MDHSIDLSTMGQAAKKAAYEMANASTAQKNLALQSIAIALREQQEFILHQNQEDITAAQAAGMSEALLDRLSLQGRLGGMAQDVLHVMTLPDPVGESFDQQRLPNGLEISKCRTPIGVLGVIYEARPNVTIDIAALTIKTGNCALLRGGSETLRSNQALAQVIQHALFTSGLPSSAIQLINSSDRSLVKDLLRLHEYIDLIIPRGGASLHQFCRENSTIPVITGGIGICHLFVDQTANLEKALSVILNAKTQRPTVCNALDTLLVHQAIASSFIPQVIKTLQDKGVQFRLDQQAWQLLQAKEVISSSHLRLAQAEDWDTEWLSLILGIKVVNNLEEAMAHIRQHSTGHSDGILTQNKQHAEKFVKKVDSAAVYVNASTRFTDGGQLGLGAEVAISTQKLHARGPMGLKELTSYKWIIWGDYQIR